jgi:cytochrome c biogenesis factor
MVDWIWAGGVLLVIGSVLGVRRLPFRRPPRPVAEPGAEPASEPVGVS